MGGVPAGCLGASGERAADALVQRREVLLCHAVEVTPGLTSLPDRFVVPISHQPILVQCWCARRQRLLARLAERDSGGYASAHGAEEGD
jgi:hypothetical protein